MGRISDPELRLFARIELAAALVDLPPASETSMKQRPPPPTQGTSAPWCGPCLLDLLAKIRAQTKGTDLAMLSIDEDEKTADSVAFLKRRGYDWPDAHYTHEPVKQLGVQGIPLIVLFDAEGKVVYYHSGADDQALTAAIAALGNEYRSVKAN